MMLSLAVFLLAAGATSTPSPTSADAELVSSLVAAAATQNQALDVLSAADVRNAVDLEAQRTIMGCDATSCLLEVAQALDARLVVHGTLGTLGASVILTLSAFDTTSSSALGRVVLQDSRIDAFGGKIPDAVVELLARVPPPTPGTRIRTVVLDVKLAAPPPPPAAPVAEPFAFPWTGVGIGLGAVGAAGVAIAVVLDAHASVSRAQITAETPAAEIVAHNEQVRTVNVPGAAVGYIVGGVFVLAGGLAMAVGAFE